MIWFLELLAPLGLNLLQNTRVFAELSGGVYWWAGFISTFIYIPCG